MSSTRCESWPPDKYSVPAVFERVVPLWRSRPGDRRAGSGGISPGPVSSHYCKHPCSLRIRSFDLVQRLDADRAAACDDGHVLGHFIWRSKSDPSGLVDHHQVEDSFGTLHESSKLANHVNVSA